MPYYGPWITPTTTRQAAIVTSIPALPLYYRRHYVDPSWDNARQGIGTVGDARVVAGTAAPDALEYTFGPNTFLVGQGLLFFDTSTTPAANMTPYTDMPAPPGATGVDYESPAGTVVATPHIGVTAFGQVDTNLPDATIDVYHLPNSTTEIAAGPGYAFFPPARITSFAADSIGATPVGGTTFLAGFTITSSTFVLLATPTGQMSTPFPYPTPGTDGELGLPVLSPNVEYIGPRFRWIYPGRPPLAHRQRRDGAATDGPPLAHIGTAGSRPPLAHRQSNP